MGKDPERNSEGPLPEPRRGSGVAVEVEIFGQRYIIRGEAEESYVRNLAAYVDGKMNEVARRMQGTHPAKAAVLAALNISHELFQLRLEQRETEGMVARKTKQFIEMIEGQL